MLLPHTLWHHQICPILPCPAMIRNVKIYFKMLFIPTDIRLSNVEILNEIILGYYEMKKGNFWHEVELQRKISPLKFVIMPFGKEIVVSLIVFCSNRNNKIHIACKKQFEM